MKNYLLLKFSADYSDEFFCEGFIAMEKEAWDNHLADVKAMFDSRPLIKSHRGEDKPKPIEVSFGTNESIYYESYDEYVSAFISSEITTSEFEVLYRYFKRYNGVQNGILCMIETN